LVAHALALVRVGTAQLADVGGDLTDELLVDPLDREAGRVLDGEGDALRRLDDDGVAEPERELEVAALVLDAVTGAVDLELLLVPGGDPDDHVVDEAAAQSVQRAGLPLVVRARDLDALVGPGDRDGLGHDGLQLTLGALDLHGLALDGDVDTAGDGDRPLSDARHGAPPYQT